MRPNEGEPVSERDHDRGVDAGQLARKDEVVRHVNWVDPVRAVVPVHAEEVQRMRLVRPDRGERLLDIRRYQLGVRELTEGRKGNPGTAKPIERSLEATSIVHLTVAVEQLCEHGVPLIGLSWKLGLSRRGGFGASAQRRSVDSRIVVRRTAAWVTMEKALLAYDGSDGAQRALRTAVELFRDRGILVTVVGVAEGIPLYGFAGRLPSPEQEEERRRQLEEAGKTLAEYGIAFALAQRSGDSASAILHEAEKEGVDLIVMGTRGLGAAERWLIGSVSDKVLHHAHCSVLVAR